jgi:hypothetical protein
MVYAILLFAAIITLIGAVRFKNMPLRRVPGIDGLQKAVSQAVESGRGAHISYGAAGLPESSTLSALASAEMSYQVAVRAALADSLTRITMSNPVILGVAQDRLRRAYRLRGSLDRYRGTLARWYPGSGLSLAFAAGVSTLMIEEDLAANALLGRFGTEMILLGEVAMRYDRNLVAHSDQIEGQAVAYVVSANTLFGEELYAGPAYFERRPVFVGGVLAQDVIRLILVISLILLSLLAFTGAQF